MYDFFHTYFLLATSKLLSTLLAICKHQVITFVLFIILFLLLNDGSGYGYELNLIHVLLKGFFKHKMTFIQYLFFLWKDGKFPHDVADMTGLRWLRLNKTGLDSIPPEIYKLKKLVIISLLTFSRFSSVHLVHYLQIGWIFVLYNSILLKFNPNGKYYLKSKVVGQIA